MIDIAEIGCDDFSAYSRIDPRYEVRSALSVTPLQGGLGGLALSEQPVESPYCKGADEAGSAPTDWPPQDEAGDFGAFLATDDNTPVAAAAIVVNPSGAFLFERRERLAGLWDIRVAPEYRRRGLGQQLLERAFEWARNRQCSQMRIECQNVNVPACRFYARFCELGGVERHGYAACPDVAHEVMLLWYRELL